ncbi:MAG: hypothetical protein KDN05_10705, partial [Verrucomicrobiae bacterium]|nr:hypothetical protein [Verrucomicrobiae bacterium]
MKASLILSGFILIVGGAIGWHDHQRLVSTCASHDLAVKEAAERGISPASISGAPEARITKKKRED